MPSFFFFKRTVRVRLRPSALEAAKLRPVARVRVRAALEKFNADGRFKFTALRLKNLTSRWGSCSSLGTLNFNVRLALIPEAIAEYVVAHELCHLLEMNHSRRFWQKVEALVPDYRERRRALKEYSLR